MKSLLPLLILLASLTGCATPPKPALPDAMYGQTARDIYGIDSCGLSNRVELSTVARARSMMATTLSSYTVDSARMTKEFEKYQALNAPVSDEWCKKTTVNILQAQQQAESKQRSSSAPSLVVRDPKFTNCSTYFGQTSCVSY